jgi:hypothetical protein
MKNKLIIKSRYNADSTPAIQRAIGKRIRAVFLDHEHSEHGGLVFEFSDESTLTLNDCQEQICCEERWLSIAADDLLQIQSAILHGVEIRDGAPVIIEDKTQDIYNEQMFIEIITSKGAFTVTAYNEHTGAYAGFDLYAVYKEPK